MAKAVMRSCFSLQSLQNFDLFFSSVHVQYACLCMYVCLCGSALSSQFPLSVFFSAN